MNKNKVLFMRALILFLLIFVLMTHFANYIYAKQGTGRHPNILLITVCSLRQDHLGCYGYSRLTTPHIDELAQISTRFTSCYTPVPWTIPSIKALMTGQYPFSSLDLRKENTLTGLLRFNGYSVFAVVGTFVEDSDFNLGFDKFFGPRNLKTSKDINTVSADVISNKAIEILATKRLNNAPVFIWVFFKDPHWQYLPPDPYKGLFVNDSLYLKETRQLNINDDFHDSLGGIGEARLKYYNGNFITNKAEYVSRYDAEIFFTDLNIGKVINYIKENENLKDWMIIFLADHGESLGEDNYFFDHGYKLSEGLIKVPLIIKLPGQERGEIRNNFVSVCDIYYTVAGLLKSKEVTKQPGAYGRSLLYKEDLLGITKSTNRMMMLNNSSIHEKGGERLFGCIWRDYKLIWNWSKNKKILYRLAKQEVLIKEYNDEQARLIREMTGLIRRFFSKRSREDQGERSNIEKLRALGYVQ